MHQFKFVLSINFGRLTIFGNVEMVKVMSSIDTERYLKLALEAAQMSVWNATVLEGKVCCGEVIWTGNGAALLGYEAFPLIYPFNEFLRSVHPQDREMVVGAMQEAVNDLSGYQIEYRVIWSDSSTHWLAAKAQAFSNPEDGTIKTLGLIWDITERKAAELALVQQKELAQATLSSIGDGVITTDANGKVQYMNRVAEQLTGWSIAEVANLPIEEIFHLVDESSGDFLENPALKCLRSGHQIGISARSQLVARSGQRIPIEDSTAPIRAGGGPVFGTVMVFHDVSHERQMKRELSWHASHDPLTGLINRREFEIHVANALASAKIEGDNHALLFLDLDQFKIVNDTCGHAAGDILLKMLAVLLQSHLRDADILARLGGDELGVLLLNCPVDQGMQIADGLRQAVKDFRFIWEAHSFEIGVSIGLVVINEDSKSMSELLSAADQACYAAKEWGRNRVNVYHESDVLVARRQRETLWVPRLNDALKKDEFRLFAQPIVALQDLHTPHVEILIRMKNDDGQLSLPGAFIPAAERYNLIATIDRWVIETVCQYLQKQHNRTEQDPSNNEDARTARIYSINLSGLSLNDDFLKGFIAEKFKQYGIDAGCICFEVTETAVISNLVKAQIFIDDIKQLGCHFSLDDFGSGLSSFAYLKALPVDYLKIDGTFVRDIVTNKVNRAMVSAINEVGHVMGIKTIAEYVEDEAILESVQDIGIDYAQGYAVGPIRPLAHVFQ